MLGAARLLGVDQTTVSRRLRLLEGGLGVQLVVRHRDGVELTEAGLKAARTAERMETAVQDLERDLVGADTELAGRLKVTTLALVTHHHPDLFTTFHEAYPAVELEVEVGTIRRALARREADLAIRWTPKPDPSLFGRKVARAEFGIYAARSLRDSLGSRPRLSSYPWITTTRDTRVPVMDAFMAEHVPDAAVVCRYDDALAMYAAVRAGAGAGIMPCAFGDPDPNLVRLRTSHLEFALDVWCLTHPDLRGTGRVRAFMRHAGEYFDARKDLYAGSRTRGRR